MGSYKEISVYNINKKYFPSSFENYTALKNERLFEVTLKQIVRWRYMEGRPFVEKYDVVKEEYSLTEYSRET